MSSEPRDRAKRGHIPLRAGVAVVAAGIMLADALGLPSEALAAEPPEGVADIVMMLTRERARPTYTSLVDDARTFLLWVLPAAALGASAAVLWWKRRAAWPYFVAALVAVAVAAWQIYVAADSMSGRPWDPAFHGVKLALLAVVVAVDLAAAGVLLRARPRSQATGSAQRGRERWLTPGLILLGEAAVLSLTALPWLALTG